MKQAEPQVNIDVIVGTICLTAFATFAGYMIGSDHVDTNLRMERDRYKAIASQPCIRAGQIKAIVYPYCKNIRKVVMK